MSNTAGYLRVKKWKDWQHYKDREPPWVKLHRKLLGDSDFMALEEWEQWQLVRVWIVCSSSSQFTLDEQQRKVPVVVDDEKVLRRAIGSLKRIPLEKLTRDGWLIAVPPDDLLPSEQAADASAAISPVLSPGYPRDSILASDHASAPREEVSENPKSEDEAKNASSSNALAIVVPLPVSSQQLVALFVDRSRTLGSDPPSAVTGQVARQVGNLVKEGFTPDRIAAGIELLLQKAMHPSTLPSLVHEAALPPRRTSRPGRVTPSEILAQAQAVHAQEEAMFHDAG